MWKMKVELNTFHVKDKSIQNTVFYFLGPFSLNTYKYKSMSLHQMHEIYVPFSSISNYKSFSHFSDDFVLIMTWIRYV